MPRSLTCNHRGARERHIHPHRRWDQRRHDIQDSGDNALHHAHADAQRWTRVEGTSHSTCKRPRIFKTNLAPRFPMAGRQQHQQRLLRALFDLTPSCPNRNLNAVPTHVPLAALRNMERVMLPKSRFALPPLKHKQIHVQANQQRTQPPHRKCCHRAGGCECRLPSLVAMRPREQHSYRSCGIKRTQNN